MSPEMLYAFMMECDPETFPCNNDFFLTNMETKN